MIAYKNEHTTYVASLHKALLEGSSYNIQQLNAPIVPLLNGSLRLRLLHQCTYVHKQ